MTSSVGDDVGGVYDVYDVDVVFLLSSHNYQMVGFGLDSDSDSDSDLDSAGRLLLVRISYLNWFHF